MKSIESGKLQRPRAKNSSGQERKTPAAINLSKRDVTLDVTRILAILAVIMIHSSAPFVREFANTSTEFFWGNLFDSFAKIANPLFIMVSGALLLDERRQVTISSLFRKNIKGILILIVFWGFVFAAVYNILTPRFSGEPVSLKKFVLSLRGYWHMWFLYMILGLYLSTPLIRTFARRETKNLALYFVAVAFATIFMIPVVSAVAVKFPGVLIVKDLFETRLYLQFFGGYAAYYVMGWYLTQFELSRPQRFILYVAGLLSGATIAAFMWFTKDRSLYDNLGIPVFLLSVAVFVAVSSLRKHINSLSERRARTIVAISNLIFGVYIIHPFFLTLVDALWPYQSSGIPPYLYIPAYFVVITIFALTTSWILSKTPGLKFSVRS